jgi:hypothetical protein
VKKHAQEPGQRQHMHAKVQAVGTTAMVEHLRRTARPCWLCAKPATLAMVRHELYRSKAKKLSGPEVCGRHLKAVWPFLPKDEIWIATEHPQAQIAKIISARASTERRSRRDRNKRIAERIAAKASTKERSR